MRRSYFCDFIILVLIAGFSSTASITGCFAAAGGFEENRKAGSGVAAYGSALRTTWPLMWAWKS